MDQAPVLVLVPPGSPSEPNSTSPSCLGLPGLIGWPAIFWISPSSRSDSLREFAGQPRQHLAVDGNAALLHAREHAHHRPLQRFIDGRHPVRGEARLHREPEPQRNIGFLCGIFRRPSDLDIVESHARFAAAGERIEIDRRVIEIPRREESDIVIRAAGIEHVGLQQCVVERRDARCRAARTSAR